MYVLLAIAPVGIMIMLLFRSFVWVSFRVVYLYNGLACCELLSIMFRENQNLNGIVLPRRLYGVAAIPQTIVSLPASLETHFLFFFAQFVLFEPQYELR